MRNARGKRRIERIHVERNVDRAVDLHAIERGQVPHFDDLDAEFLCLLALMPGHRPNADLDQPLGRAFLHDARKRASVRQPVAFEFVVEIGVRVEVENGQSGNVLAEGAHDRQGNRVVAAQANRTQSLSPAIRPTFLSMATNGSSKVNFKSPASQYGASALRSTPVSVHKFDEMELKATRMIGGAPGRTS
jgi:hypothetical protein